MRRGTPSGYHAGLQARVRRRLEGWPLTRPGKSAKATTDRDRHPSVGRRCLPLLIVVASVAAYHNSFSGAFVLDDVSQIAENRRMQDWRAPLEIIRNSRRPVVELTFAANYAVHGLDVRGYHAVNLAIHTLAALTLFGVVRGTLSTRRFGTFPPGRAVWFALSVALLWVVHPLTTQSVTYTVQRCESMMGLFYLLTLYCFVRGAASSRGLTWYVLAVACCGLGMASKAVMITAPLVVLLYDRVFITTSLREALARRWGLYLGLAATWGVLGACGIVRGVLFPGDSPATVGFGTATVTPLQYAATQPGVIVHYVRLALWPDPLCLDYGWPLAQGVRALVPVAILIFMLGATVTAMWKRPALGFLAAWFFIVLAPTSSFIPIKDIIFEHRMYLSLAAVVVLVVFGVDRLLIWMKLGSEDRTALRRGVAGALVTATVIVAAGATISRNRAYHSERSIWADVVSKRPENPRGPFSPAVALAAEGRADEAVEQYRRTVKLAPQHYIAHNNLGVVLSGLGECEAAIPHYETSARIKPSYTRAQVNWATCLERLGRHEEAIARFEAALQTTPARRESGYVVEAHFRLGNAWMRQDLPERALAHYAEAVRLEPNHAGAIINRASALLACNREDEAIEKFKAALKVDAVRSQPGLVLKARVNLGNALFGKGEYEPASRQYVEALKVKPNHFRTHYNLGLALARLGRLEEAAKEFRETLRLKPDHTGAQQALDALPNSGGNQAGDDGSPGQQRG